MQLTEQTLSLLNHQMKEVPAWILIVPLIPGSSKLSWASRLLGLGMGLASYLIWQGQRTQEEALLPLTLYFIHLVLVWSRPWIFFAAQEFGWVTICKQTFLFYFTINKHDHSFSTFFTGFLSVWPKWTRSCCLHIYFPFHQCFGFFPDGCLLALACILLYLHLLNVELKQKPIQPNVNGGKR